MRGVPPDAIRETITITRNAAACFFHLRRHGCNLKREGRAHSLWLNPTTGAVEAVPRHSEIPDRFARKVCRNLSVPEIGRE